MEIIGLSGKAGSGKDFIAKEYLFPLGYHQYSLAWHFKVGIVGEGQATYEDVFFNKPPSIRHILQQKGTEEGRMKYGEDVWLNHAYTWMQVFRHYWNVDKFVVPDIRFPDEVEFIQQHGGKVFRVNAPLRTMNSGLSIEAKMHVSETALDMYTGFDGIVENDPQYQDSVQIQILHLLT